ncbi:TGM1 [Lepeophtheirus salmonis]|uniref:TGM1 n=1 Tax=Lepeophtheirus salmonis TaxID=72036 RepID=A0A7R8CDL1_LEPSM|nr:TGM1 [Lepeophtheirus salmonis]CAF2782168.1 TGM1 [Lepeophtheirus salmonis]
MASWTLDWPEWNRWRTREYYSPPLWYFHRALSNRDNDNVIEDTKNHILEIEGIDWKIRENANVHKTTSYDLVNDRTAAVLRRGESFNLGIKFRNTRSFDINNDNVRLYLEFGIRPSLAKGTRVIIDVSTKDTRNTFRDSVEYWFAHFLNTGPKSSSVEIVIYIPSDIPVGIWRLSVLTWYGKATEISNNMTKSIWIMMWREQNTSRKRRFRDSVLPAVIHLLDRVAKRLNDTERGHAVRVVRAISAVINSNDDFGVLQGRWDGNYSDGTRPFEWTGSVAILEQYMQTFSPVKYGQCCFFAGLVTTVCRAIGIPCRDVTCFLSAHDTNKSFSIDKFYDEEGEEIDSIWNFHVWNEVWMDRKVSEYSGWQVIDATPQEESDSMMRCGPAPVRAIKRGDVGTSFDADFIYSAVNADIFHYIPDKKSAWQFRLVNTNTSHVGRLLVTKKVGHLSEDSDEDFYDLTMEYKPKEGSISERNTMIRALRISGGETSDIRRFPGIQNNDVFFQIINLDQGVYGEVYAASLYVHNQAKEDRTLDLIMSTSSVFYTGNMAQLIKKAHESFVLKAHERETFSLTVDPADYMPKTVEYCIFVNHFTVRVEETGQTWMEEDDFILDKPKLSIRIEPELPRLYRDFTLIISFTNPLNNDLSKCDVTIEAPGIIASTKRKFRMIAANEKVDIPITLRAKKSGITTAVATFNSRELYDINGTKKIHIVS